MTLFGQKPLLLVLSILLLPACGGSEPAGNEPLAIGIETSDDDAIEAAIDAAPEPQQRYLEDRALTFAEYEQSFFAYVSCLEEAGFNIASDSYRDEQFQVVFSQRNDGTPIEEQDKDAESCYVQQHEVIQILWVYLNRPSESEQAEKRATVASCLQDQGIAISDNPTQQEISDIAMDGQMDTVANCTPG